MFDGLRTLNDIKSLKVDPNIELNKQMEIYRKNLTPFYNSKKIQIITEDELKSGNKTLNMSP
jgi:hypothetical protein